MPAIAWTCVTATLQHALDRVQDTIACAFLHAWKLMLQQCMANRAEYHYICFAYIVRGRLYGSSKDIRGS